VTGVRWRAAIILIAGSLVYLNSVSNPFAFDDASAIVENEEIRHLSDLSSVLSPERERPVAGRPLVNLSFAINYAIGDSAVAGYHAWNIAVHLVCGILLFALVRRALSIANDPAVVSGFSRTDTNLAFAAALIWTLHPLNTEAVDYLTQRTESMMALFYLLTLYASVRALTARRARRWHALAVLSCALGMACKESMVTAPVVVLLFDRIFVFDSFREAWRRRAPLYVGLAATWLLLAGLLSTGPRRRSAGFSTGLGPWTYLLNQPPMIVRYLRLAVWPRSLVLNYGWPRPLGIVDVLPSALFILALLALTIVALRVRPKAAFLAVCFWITLAPTSSIVPIATEVGAERRMYLPLAAFIVLLVVGAARLAKEVKGKSPAFLLAALSIALAAGTLVRNREYSSPVVMARTILDRYPTPFAHHVLAEQLLTAGNRQEAMDHLRQAVPGAPRAHFNLGVELLKDGTLDEGVAELRTFVREQPYLAQVVAAHEYIGRAFEQQERWPEAANEYQEILKSTPDNPPAEHLLADALFAAHDMTAAIAHYRTYLASVWNDVGALNNLGIAFGTTGQLDEAIASFRGALQLDPGSGAAERNLASALWLKHDVDEALVHAQRAVALQPGDAGSRELLTQLQQLQRGSAAVRPRTP
jgi:tetratricopeptide (TPR) repeat protein